MQFHQWLRPEGRDKVESHTSVQYIKFSEMSLRNREYPKILHKSSETTDFLHKLHYKILLDFG